MTSPARSAVGYRQLLTKPVLVWAAVAVGARLPVAMAPLALVFLVRERPGGYVLGAALGAVYVLGEVVGAVVLGPRLRSDRARGQLAAGMAVGAVAFAGLGLFSHTHPLVLGALAVIAGAAPAAAPGGLRTLLTAQLPEALVVKAMSAEAVLTYVVWAVAPALAGVLALGVAAPVPLLLAAVLMIAATAGMWALPTGWTAEENRKGMARTLARAWPIYLTGAAAMSLLALAELVLPALLEQRSIGVGWTGPLLAGFAVASAAGAALYGLRTSWPGSLRTQSLVLLLAVAGCVTVIATVGSLPWIAGALLVGGLFQAGVMVSRTLALREALPPHAHAAAYSVMYAVSAVGYATSATVAGAAQSVATPSVALLAGVGLTLILVATSALGSTP